MRIDHARECLAEYHQHKDIITLGAYKNGSNQSIDRAIALRPALNQFLKQSKDQVGIWEENMKTLQNLLQNKPKPGLETQIKPLRLHEKFRFKLNSVLNLRTQDENAAAQHHAEALKRVQALQEEIQQLEHSLEIQSQQLRERMSQGSQSVLIRLTRSGMDYYETQRSPRNPLS